MTKEEVKGDFRPRKERERGKKRKIKMIQERVTVIIQERGVKNRSQTRSEMLNAKTTMQTSEMKGAHSLTGRKITKGNLQTTVIRREIVQEKE